MFQKIKGLANVPGPFEICSTHPPRDGVNRVVKLAICRQAAQLIFAVDADFHTSAQANLPRHNQWGKNPRPNAKRRPKGRLKD
jgi:hypothetical protein